MDNVFSIKVNNKIYDNFLGVSVYKSIENACGEFTIDYSNTGHPKSAFAKGDKCEVLIDNVTMITGYINTIAGSYDAGGHSLTMTGRDKTQDLVDCSIDKNLNLKSPISLENIIYKVLSLNGINDILVVNKENLKVFSSKELVNAEQAENAFKFIDRYCRMRQVVFTTDGQGDIIITRAGTEKYSNKLLCLDNNTSNNILQANFVDSDSQRYYNYVVHSQTNPSANGFDDSFQSKKGSLPKPDSNIRSTRTLHLITDVSSDLQTCQNRAIWEANIRRARGFVYNCKIRGYKLDNKIIAPNNIVTVQDDMFGINSDLLIKSCRYSQTLQGKFTDLELVNKDSYTLKAEQDKIEEIFNVKNKKIGGLGF